MNSLGKAVREHRLSGHQLSGIDCFTCKNDCSIRVYHFSIVLLEYIILVLFNCKINALTVKGPLK